MWVATRASLRSVLEAVTIADVAAGSLPPVVKELTSPPDAWLRGSRRRRPAGGPRSM